MAEGFGYMKKFRQCITFSLILGLSTSEVNSVPIQEIYSKQLTELEGPRVLRLIVLSSF